MNKKEFLAELEDILEVDEGTLSFDQQVSELEDWDSLAVISFIAMADENFDVILDGEQLLGVRTIDDLYALVAPAGSN